jgi:hypothetical protein
MLLRREAHHAITGGRRYPHSKRAVAGAGVIPQMRNDQEQAAIALTAPIIPFLSADALLVSLMGG